MSKYIIDGGNSLEGSLDIQGSKNSVLPLLSASIMTNEPILLKNCPNISDVRNMLKILQKLGCVVNFEDGNIYLDSKNIDCGEIPQELAKELRSSIFLLGALLSRLKKAKVAYPGGCDIGMRPIDIHLSGLRALNINIYEHGGYIYCDSENARSAEIVLNLPSVGATENIIMASVFLKGETIIRNCAKEPEIVDLQNFLNKMGARVRGAGTSVIYIQGVGTLYGCEHRPIPDRIVAGTYIIASAMCGGDIELRNINSSDISSLLSKLAKTTCNIQTKGDRINIRSKGRLDCLENIETMYFPGFPTDLQTQVLALQTISNGTCVIVENIFETRFRPVTEFKKMGADIVVIGRTAIVKGVPALYGAEVNACDLRGGASLVLGGLVAKGRTIVNDIYHIERGYEDMDICLANLGANIKKVEE